MQKNHWLISGFILAATVGTAPVFAETLQEAMAQAYASNPTLQSERARLRATDELVPQALSNWRPNVSVSGNATRSSLDSHIKAANDQTGGVSGSFSQIYNNENVGVNVTQPLYRGGRTVAQTRQAEAQVNAERAQLQVTEQQVLLNVATVYMNLVQAQAVLQLSINNEQVLQRQLDAVEDRFRVGEVTRTDVAQAQSRLSAAHADRTQAEGNLRTARANYLQVVGHSPERVDAPLHLPDVPANFEQAKTQAASQNPNILLASHNYEASLAAIDLVEGELLPTVALTGTAQRVFNYNGPGTIENTAQATIGITVPIYQQGQEYSRLRAQKQTAGQLRSTLDQAHLDVEDSTASAWEALQTGHARRLSYQDQIKAAQIALEGVQRESQVGSRTVIEVLNAEQELLQAQVNETQAQHDEVVAAYQLLSAVGQLNPQYLNLSVEVYDPTLHYEEVRDKWAGFGDMPNQDKKDR